MVTIEIGEDGRIVSPRGVKVNLPIFNPRSDSDEERRERLRAFVERNERILADVPRHPVSDEDPVVAKFRAMGLLD
ncbi:hypothetical protein BH11ARM2_BH11ARM2_35470 [soil metagenome]